MTTISDNFNRANNSLGSPWTAGTGENGLNIVSNTIQESSGADCSSLYDVATTWGNDQSSKCKLTINGANGSGAGGGLYVRHAVSSKTGYRWVIDHAGSNNTELARFNSGAFTSLDVRTQTFVDGDEFELRVTGSVGAVALAVYRNGVLSYTVNDTSGSGLGSGKPGLAYSSTETLVTWDDWTGTDSFAAASTDISDTIVVPNQAVFARAGSWW